MNKQKIGIWGSGAVGKSALAFFEQQGNVTELLDLKEPSHPDLQLLKYHHYTQQKDSASIHAFFERNDIVIASPGIDTTPYHMHAHKLMSELDIVAASTKTPIIGITGTIGKTTVTTLLAHYLNKLEFSIGAGGNLGTPMLNFTMDSKKYDYLVFELSSFQLEYTQQAAPHLAIWTNFYPNHIDRHKTIEAYFKAKATMFAYQTAAHHALLPLAISRVLIEYDNLNKMDAQLSFFSLEKPSPGLYTRLPERARLFYIEDNSVIFQNNIHDPSTRISLISLQKITATTFKENVLILVAALHCLNQPLDILLTKMPSSLEHRLEFVTHYNGIDVYNDSKSTIMQSTLAAIQTLSPRPIILLCGGISKGVDRSAEFKKLPRNVKKIICFGKEAECLAEACNTASIPAHKTYTLEEAYHAARAEACPGDTILFSPGGASYDLFEHYIERGNKFKELVLRLTTK